jgi:hypothetical protein
MRKSVLRLVALSLVCISSASIAQPTLTSNGSNFLLGNSYSSMTSNYANPGNAGANQTWDISSVSGTTSALVNFVLPSTTSYGSSFPQANIACTSQNTTSVGYYKTTASAMQLCGTASSVTMIYSDIEDMMRYPCTYNSTYTDTWATNFNSGGYNFHRKGTTTVTADSYGTLITPNGTYTNVMRIHFVQTYQDSAYIGAPYIINYVNDEYMWYKEGINAQLATMFTINTSTGNNYTGGSYITGNTGLDNSPEFQISSNLYPNPATDKVTIEYTLAKNQNVEIRLINSMGQQIKRDYNSEGVQGKNVVNLEVTNLPDGIYFAQIYVEGNLATSKRFVCAACSN